MTNLQQSSESSIDCSFLLPQPPSLLIICHSLLFAYFAVIN